MAIEQQRGEPILIVVVEDNSDDVFMTMRALRKLSPSPTIKLVRDGAEAVECLIGDGACHPEMVFLDLKLPKVHGLEILRLMREDPIARSIPVVVLTSSDDPKDIATAKELGASEYIRKPIDWLEYAHLLCVAAEKFMSSGACGN